MTLLAIDHVQLAMPTGEEARARVFYADLLGMVEIEKPPVLAVRGGAWFETGKIKLHLGVEEDFRPAKKAHVALQTSDGAGLRQKLKSQGYPVREDGAIEGVKRFFTDDVFGNRIEFIEVEQH